MVKDTEKKRLMALFVSVLLFSGHASSTNFTPGQLALSGELVAAACDIDPSSRELWVDFGNISARDINMDQEGKLVRPFLVRLVGCASYGSVIAGPDRINSGWGRKGVWYTDSRSPWGSFNFWRTLFGISAK